MKLLFAPFLLPLLVSSFRFPMDRIAIKEGLIQAVESQKTTSVDVKLEIGTKRESKMSINGLKLNLFSDPVSNNYDHPSMPGINGPHPQLSSGIRALEVVEDGWFIDMTGKRSVQLKNGCWEMVWRENAVAGTLVCGFDVTETYNRNEATLSPCQLYMSFPVWTSEELKKVEQEKKKVVDRAQTFMNKRDSEVAKMDATSNPIMKALHFRNAYAAMDKYSMQNVRSYDVVPSKEEIIPLGLDPDMLLTTKGLAFSKEGNFKKGQHVLLGAAHVAEDSTGRSS